MRSASWAGRGLAAGVLCLALAGLMQAPISDVYAESDAMEGGEAFKIKGDAARGLAIYNMYCTVCHGDKGKGDGPGAMALIPKPKDLTNAEVMSKITDREVFLAIRDGGPAVGLSPLMAPWLPVLQDEQKVHDVAAYVRSLAKPAP